jgi:hypothetical protein
VNDQRFVVFRPGVLNAKQTPRINKQLQMLLPINFSPQINNVQVNHVSYQAKPQNAIVSESGRVQMLFGSLLDPEYKKQSE